MRYRSLEETVAFLVAMADLTEEPIETDDEELAASVTRVVGGWRVEFTRFSVIVGGPAEIYASGGQTFETANEAAGAIGGF